MWIPNIKPFFLPWELGSRLIKYSYLVSFGSLGHCGKFFLMTLLLIKFITIVMDDYILDGIHVDR
jgi:hypothetical protein